VGAWKVGIEDEDHIPDVIRSISLNQFIGPSRIVKEHSPGEIAVAEAIHDCNVSSQPVGPRGTL
jgi:hypothetical protein